jgi:hypothetical protein
MKMRFGLGVLAYLAPTFALGFVWHLVLFHAFYEHLAIYRNATGLCSKPEPKTASVLSALDLLSSAKSP